MILAKDAAVLERHAREGSREYHEERLKQWIADQVAHAVYLEDNDFSPANADRQTGQPMFATELERRLKALKPSLLFEVNPFNHTKKALYIRRHGQKEFICAYENGVMPEHSVMRVKEEEVRDMSVRHIDRRDMPKGEFVPGYGWKFDPNETRPGFKKVKIPYGEQTRGWRTVLLKLVLSGVLTVTEVEKAFGADDRPEWAGTLGKQTKTRPW